MPDKPHFHGHRQRLRERFLKGGSEALADYELLELTLFSAYPRGDVKPLAKDLIATFGSFAEVVSADHGDLRRVKGLGEAGATAIKIVQAAAVRLARDTILHRPVLGSWQELTDYCRSCMAFGKTEQLRVLYLNKRNELIADELAQEGTVDHTPVYPREVIKRALNHGATALILVHNHPSGDPEPSREDIEITREIAEVAAKMDIALHDHVIVSRKGYASLKSMGFV